MQQVQVDQLLDFQRLRRHVFDNLQFQYDFSFSSIFFFRAAKQNPNGEKREIDGARERERERGTDLREEIGDVEALSDESEQALESLALLGVELAVEERSDVDVVGVVVEVGVGADAEDHGRGLAQRLRRGSELREHLCLCLCLWYWGLGLGLERRCG